MVLGNNSRKCGTDDSCHRTRGITYTHKYTSIGRGNIQKVNLTASISKSTEAYPSVINITAKVGSMTYPAATGNTNIRRKPEENQMVNNIVRATGGPWCI